MDAQHPLGHAIRALVADDHPTNRLLMRTILAQLGCEVFVAEDGVEAHDFARLSAFDLIVMDRNMPGCNGDAAAMRIRRPECASAMSVIVLWTTDPPSAALPAVYDDALPKPAGFAGVIAMLERAVERLRQAPARMPEVAALH